MASREISDVGSNVTFMLAIPHLKVKMQCVSVKVVLNRSVLSICVSLSASVEVQSRSYQWTAGHCL